MLSKLSAETLIPLSVEERKSLILHHASLIDATHINDEDLHIPYKYGKILSSIAQAYFECQLAQDRQNGTILELDKQYQSISSKTDRFTDNFIEWLKADFQNQSLLVDSHPKPKNLFELCGAKLLMTSNSVTRNLSTKMGKLWEDIADISPYIIIPEIEFGIKIKGIDLVILSQDKIVFAQIKTLKGTLTGSQRSRAKKELSIHENPLFISAFDLGEWTFNDPQIPRLAGKDFWDIICIHYDVLEEQVKHMLQRIDRAFAKLAAQ